MTSTKLAAGSAFPSMRLPILGGGERDISKPGPGFDWMLVIVYRGMHCPLCTSYLSELKSRLAEFNAQGVDVIAVSADRQERAARQMVEVAPNFDVAYGLTVTQMRQLGLYISDPRNGMDVEAPFAEPGLFVLDENGAVQIIGISNVPFSRPSLEWIAKGVSFRRGPMRNAPIKGTYAPTRKEAA